MAIKKKVIKKKLVKIVAKNNSRGPSKKNKKSKVAKLIKLSKKNKKVKKKKK